MLERQNQLYIGSILAKRPLPENSYLNDLPVVRWLMERKELKLDSPVTFLVGENGAGKSTLLEAIAVNFGFNPEGGTRNFNFTTYASHSELHAHIALAKYRFPKDGFYLRAESFYNMASDIDRIAENELPENADLSKAHLITFSMEEGEGLRYGFLKSVHNNEQN